MANQRLNEELSRIKKMMIEQENNYNSEESGEDQLDMSDYETELSNERDGKTYPFLVDDEVTYTISTSIDLLNQIKDNVEMDEKEKRDLIVLITNLLENASDEVSHEMSTDEVIELWNNISNN
jgi:hypothetical protein